MREPEQTQQEMGDAPAPKRTRPDPPAARRAEYGEPVGAQTAPGDPASAPGDPVTAPVDPATARRRLRSAFAGPRRTQFIVAAVACVVALATVWQIRSHDDDEMYRTARRADLIQLVDGLSEETRRLETELEELEQTRRELESGNDARRVARDQTQRRLDTLAVLAGTAPATGPGVRIIFTDPDRKLGASVLLNAMGEMRDAGAEVMEFNDSVRVVANTWVGGSPGGLVVDGTQLPEVIVLEAIGDPHSLEEAARFRGGLASEVTGPQVGGRIDIEQLPQVDITSVRTPTERVWAQPVD